MTGNGRQISPTEAQYQWPQPQPFRSLSVGFNDDAVLPAEIAIRRTSTSPWQPLTKTVLWQRNGQRSAPVELAGETVQAVRITTLDARLPDTLPEVSGSRDRLALVFNAQGKGPFMLAWGNKAAQPAAVTPDTLIPPDLRKQLDPASIPDAFPGENVKLGGEARMTATSVTEQQGDVENVAGVGGFSAGRHGAGVDGDPHLARSAESLKCDTDKVPDGGLRLIRPTEWCDH